MSIRLPNKSIVSIASGYSAAKTVTALSNASEAVATAAAHGLAVGDYIEVTSGWPGINSRIVRVKTVGSTGQFTMEGIDTTDTNKYPTGAGIGSVRKITGWTPIQQILSIESQGGDQNYWEYQFLEDDTQKRLKTFKSAQGLNLSIGDDPSLTGYLALVTANDDGNSRAFKVVLPNGSILLYQMDVSINKTPTLTVNQGMAVSAALSLVSDVVRYAS